MYSLCFIRYTNYIIWQLKNIQNLRLSLHYSVHFPERNNKIGRHWEMDLKYRETWEKEDCGMAIIMQFNLHINKSDFKMCSRFVCAEKSPHLLLT